MNSSCIKPASAWLFASLVAATPALAQVTAGQLAATEIRTEQVGENLWVLFGLGGNIAASIGEQGVLIVDTQFPELVPKYRAALAGLGADRIDFAIDTHWHYDHADGNQRLGPEGVWIIAQQNSRAMMLRDKLINTVTRPLIDQPAYAANALPVATFDDAMQLHFNGETIDVLHFGPAHTTGDAAVIFRGHNAVHTGDVFISAGYPFVDADNGGDLDGMIVFLESVLDELEPGATVIPGHGPVSDYAALARYVEMLTDVRNTIAALIADGATLEQVVAARPTAAWDATYGDPTGLVDRAYLSLTRARQASIRERQEAMFRRNVGTPEQQRAQFPPHRIVGNLYYVGSESLASYLVATPEGHILINTNWEDGVPNIRASVEDLGFDFEDIEIILGSHAHADHMQGDARVKELTGASVMAMAEDVPLLERMQPGGKPHPIDRILHDGDAVSLGGSTLVARRTPGHTPGCTTWTMTIEEDGESYEVVIIGSMGSNPGFRFVDNPDNPTIADQYRQGFAVLRSLSPDIPLASHPAMYNMVEKVGRIGGTANPFVDPAGYRAEIDAVETLFLDVLAEQQREARAAAR